MILLLYSHMITMFIWQSIDSLNIYDEIRFFNRPGQDLIKVPVNNDDLL